MRVVEVFGPTVQGEGPEAGRVTHFLRFGGCDYRCSWCDTMYAVEPEVVRLAENLTVGEVVERLAALSPAPMLVISGGNPALQKLDPLLDALAGVYETVAVETQGSLWRSWLERVDALVVSPKPPSSGEATARNWDRFEVFMGRARSHPGLTLKVVVFDEDDFDWAAMVHRCFARVPFYLSAGTDPGDEDYAETLTAVGMRYGWLCERVAGDERLRDARVLPQLHVVAWGRRVGV